jgi:endonuclease/exonuclease/phosphatase family metal-dependent hydrolase
MTVLRVVQLNIGSLLEPQWDRRRHEVLAWLDRLAPDIVCLQEVWEDANTASTAGWLVEHAVTAAQPWHWCFGGFPFPEGLWPDTTMRFGSAILSRWPIEHHELLPLPVDDRPDPPHPVYRLQLELLHARTNGFDVFSTHLAPPPAQAYHRVEQVRFIDEAIRARHDPANSPLPPILCGDFNAEPESDEIRFLTSTAVLGGRSTYFQDAWKAGGPEGDPGWTQHPDNEIYAPLGLPRKRIDYVLVGDPFGRRGNGLVRQAALAFHEPITGIVASDHYGLVVDIGWPDRVGARRS